MKRPLSKLNPYFFKYKNLFLAGALCVVLSNVFGVFSAVYVREAFDAVMNLVGLKKSQEEAASLLSPLLLKYVAFIIGASLIRGIFMFMMRQTLIVMSRHIEYEQKNEIYKKYQELDTAFFEKNNTGDLMNRISEDVGRVRMYTGPALMYMINLFSLIIIIVGGMWAVNHELTLWVLAPLPLLAFSIYFVNDLIEKRSDAMQARLSDLTSFVQESFSGLRIIKAFAKENSVLARFGITTETYKNHALHLAKVEAMWFPSILLLIGLSSILAVYIGGKQVIAGEITAGNIVEFIIYINMLAFPVTSLGWAISLTQRAKASQIRINQFLETQPKVKNTNEDQFSFEKQIVFNEVSFTYEGAERAALSHISFKLDKGKSLGVIGPTGSGKTTLAALLLRMYDATDGAVEVDAQNIMNINLKHLREQIGYVPQDVFLFSETIKNNITFGIAEEPSLEKVVNAAKQANLYENIMGFEDGFETIIGERGISLSGGQKQRLSIARALIKQPEILVLDDCLSAVDTETEAQILSNLRGIQQGVTSVIISHRVSAIMQCDEIMVIEGGEISERGAHAELLELGGYYAALYEKQLMETKIPVI
jgi:ATP-binding cassette subfamily B protein